MKKPTGISHKEWAKYKTDLALALNVMNRALDVIADANFLAGEEVERNRIIKLLEPLAKHDESCYYKKQLACYPEDCQASSYQYAIELIKGEQK